MLLTSLATQCLQVFRIVKQTKHKKNLGSNAQSQAFMDEDDGVVIGTSLQIKAADLEAAYSRVTRGGCSSMSDALAAMNAEKVEAMEDKKHSKSKEHHHHKRAHSPESPQSGKSKQQRCGPPQVAGGAAANLPPNWHKETSTSGGPNYYYNTVTLQSIFEFPVVLPPVRHVFVDWSNVVSHTWFGLKSNCLHNI